MEKEGKVNTKFFISVIFFALVTVFVIYAISFDDTFRIPTDGALNTTRNVNFTFNVTWDGIGETVGNCSLWTNFSGTWESNAEFNGSLGVGAYNESSNIANASISNINYTFSHDIGSMEWSIACRNGTTGDATNLSFIVNRTLAVDARAPNITHTTDLFPGFNTSDSTPTITFVISDTANGTGINLTGEGNNSLNVSISNAIDTAILRTYNASNENLSCTNAGIATLSTTCTLDVSGFPFTNGSKNLTISVTDRGGNINYTSIQFIVDQIPPLSVYFNITNTSDFNTSGDADNNGSIFLGSKDPSTTPVDGPGTSAQALVIYTAANFSENLTQTLRATFEFYNITTPGWQVLNETPSGERLFNVSSWANFSYLIPAGHNEFEGRNVSFRVRANDTVGNLGNTTNITIMVNDTTDATITINGTLSVNGSNLTNTRPIISWAVVDNSPLTSINVSIDGTGAPGTGTDSCKKSAFYDTSSGDDNVEANRNNSFQISTATGCPLGNGTHVVNVSVVDTAGNTITSGHYFSVQTGSSPALQFNLTNEDAIGTWSNAGATNETNITSKVGITLFGANGVGSNVDKISYISSCNSTSIVVVDNNTVVYPFNESSCDVQSANRTITVSINDTAGNSNTTVLGFVVDNVGPVITVHSPTAKQRFINITEVNLSVFDSESRVEWVRYFIDGKDGSLNHSQNGTSLTPGFGQNTTIFNRNVNHTGRHIIKIMANDTLGNIRNSSLITFTQTGPIEFKVFNASINDYIWEVFKDNITNVSIRIKNSEGYFNDSAGSNETDNTFEILFNIKGLINVSLAEVNGSEANWDKINFTPFINDTKTELDLSNNWTNTILNSTVFNNSIEEFIDENNSYYGVVLLPFNLSGTTATAQEFWWITDQDTLTTRTNISQCTAAFLPTTTTPCWNYTSNGKTIVHVPHFSVVAAVNDSDAPTINVTTPAGNHTVSTFLPNISVSADAKSCSYYTNISSAPTNKSMTLSGQRCIGSAESFKNLEAVAGYNITFWVTDNNGNINQYEYDFNMTDNTAPTTSGSITSSVSSSTEATVTVSANESVNVTVNYGSTNTTLGSKAHETDFTVSQTVSITGLTASTTYYYNVSICDFNNNCQTNGTFNFITDAAASSSSSSSSSSSGGGGGGGAVSKVTASKAQVWSSIPSGSSVSVNVNNDKISVFKISVNKIKAEMANVEIEVAALSENPISTEAAAKVFQYFRINTKNIKEGDQESIKIGFRVSKSWLTDNSLASGDISLYRYNNDQWNELAAAVTGTDSVYVNYEAETPGFSSFAVGVKSGAIAAEEEAPEEAGEVPDVAPGEATPPIPVDKPAPGETPRKAPIAWIIAAVVIILGIVLIVMYQKKKKGF